MDDNNSILERYLDKVLAVEQETNYYQNNFKSDGGSAYSTGGSSSSSSQYFMNEFVDNRDLSGLKQEVYSNVPSNNAWWPTKGINAGLANHYKGSKQKVLDNVVMHLDYYRQHNKIKLPTCSRSVYVATMLKYIEDNATYKTIQNLSMFSRIDESKFIVSLPAYRKNQACYYYLRKDMNIYLDALWQNVHKELGVTKLTINSGYRDVEHNGMNVYGGNPGSSKYGAHIAGLAVDISAHGRNRGILAAEAERMGFGEIYVSKGFVHIDIGPYFRYQDPKSGVPKFISATNPGVEAYAK